MTYYAELYKLEFIQVNLCAHVKHKDLKRANEKKKDYDTKLLEYCYSVEQNEEGSPIFFVIFRPHRKAKEFKKMQVYPTCVLNVGRLEGHRNLEDPSLSISDSPCSAASNSPLLATQLKRIQEQCGLITDSESSSPPNSQNNHAGFTVLSVKNHPDDSASQHNISSDTTSSSLELQATPTVAQVASQYSLTQLPRRGKSKSGVRQKPVGPSFVDESSISRPSELGTSTPLIDKTSWPHQGTRADLENIEICQQPVLNRRSNRKADSNSKANREPLSSIDLNINSRGTRIQIQTSLLPRPKKVGFADIANKLRS